MNKFSEGAGLRFWMRAAGVAVLWMGFAGCAATLKVARMKPAEINLAAFKKIAVADITGEGGQEIADTMNQALFDSQRFEVLDRQNLTKIMKEQNLVIGEAFDPSQSVQIGKLLGSAAMIFGGVTTRKYDEKKTYEDKQCTQVVGGQTVTRPCRVYTVTGTWNVNMGLKVVDTATGKMVATKAFKEQDSKKVSATDAVPAIDWDKDAVFSDIQGKIVVQFMKVIAPYTEMVDVELFKSGDLPEMEKGINFGKRGEWADAIEQFRTAVGKADNDPKIKNSLRAKAHYDLGVALGYSGQYDEGLKELKKANDLEASGTFDKEIGRIKQYKKDAEKLKQQGVGAESSSVPPRPRFVVAG
ncbi:MAG: hypothetical protein HYT87_06250 [Nitrospirae bacterium]|nr:hypothetical protein [Nitrospirota bacterium]